MTHGSCKTCIANICTRPDTDRFAVDKFFEVFGGALDMNRADCEGLFQYLLYEMQKCLGLEDSYICHACLT